MINRVELGSYELTASWQKDTPGSNGITKTSDYAFGQIMDATQNLFRATNEAEQLTTQLTYDFITGKDDNIHNLMIAQEKSSLLLQYTMQVRNNVLEAYQEIMRIPV